MIMPKKYFIFQNISIKDFIHVKFYYYIEFFGQLDMRAQFHIITDIDRNLLFIGNSYT